jgi:hypothetical protein
MILAGRVGKLEPPELTALHLWSIGKPPWNIAHDLPRIRTEDPPHHERFEDVLRLGRYSIRAIEEVWHEEPYDPLRRIEGNS